MTADDWGDTGTVEVGDLGAPRPPRYRPRPVVLVAGAVLLVALGFLGGVLTDRALTAAAPPVPGEASPLVGVLESAVNGTVAVRTADGRLVAVRTSPATRVVPALPSGGPTAGAPSTTGAPSTAGIPAPGTAVEVVGVRDTDGALTASLVAVASR